MFHNHKDLIRLSGESLGVDAASLELEEIQKGGSERRFFRLRSSSLDENVILLEYAQGREENNYYAAIAQFLEQTGVPAPRLRGQNEPERLVWMEDLGNVDLHDLSDQDWSRRRGLYEKAIQGLRPLHSVQACRTALDQGIPMMPGFDADSYRWERNYFRQHYLGSILGMEVEDSRWASIDKELDNFVGQLLSLPQVLIHRDFQSQNIMVVGDDRDRVAFIDFQGMRPGVAVYDLASLIEDPYARLSTEEKSEVVSMAGEFCDPEALRCAGIQRLMQALGAYGNLGIVQGKKWFLQHVPVAGNRLRQLATESNLVGLADLMDEALTVRPE